MATPHNDLFRFTFRHARHAAAWLPRVLPVPLATAIDWMSLMPAPEALQRETLRLQVADLVFLAALTVTGTPLWLLVEHKSYRDPEVESQLLRYVVHLRDRVPRAGTRPPIAVVAVLLHQGEESFAIAAPDPGGVLSALRPRLTFFVDDLSQRREIDLRERGLTPLGTLTLLCLRFLRSMSASDALAAFERWGDLLRAADTDEGPPPAREAIRAIGWYVLRVTDIPARDLQTAFEHLLQRPEETIMSTAERLLREGLERGRMEGRVEILLRQVTKRFGPPPAPVHDRIRSATSADLDLWIDRILDARTLGDVFGD